MAIKPREKLEQKKQLTQRDDFLAIVAFAAAGGMHWYARESPGWATILEPLSYVVGGIGVVIVLSALQAKMRKNREERRTRRR